MSHHVLRYVHRKKLLPVVDIKGMTDHFGKYRRPSRPCLDNPFIISVIQLKHLFIQFFVDKGALLYRT